MKKNFLQSLFLLVSLLIPGIQAHAEIIYSGIQNVVYSEHNYQRLIHLFNSGENWDQLYLDLHVFEDPSFQNTYSFSTMLETHGNYVQFALGEKYRDIKRFTKGEWIGDTNDWHVDSYKDFSNYIRFLDDPYPYAHEGGEFRNERGYAGLRLIDGENIYYGWIQIEITNYDNSSITATLIDWAYEDVPETAIQAGAVVVPEPSTVALLLSGLSIFGILSIKQRG